MATLTLANMASRVLRNLQIPEDSSSPSVQALADAKQYCNERARDVWKRRLWREYLILGTFSVPATTNIIALSSIVPSVGFTTSARGFNSAFFEVAAAREGNNPIMPEDPSAIQKVNASLWASTTSPVTYVNLGQTGIYLLGQYSASTALSFFGKAKFQDLTDSETWIMDNENCLIAGATGDMIKYHERDNNRAQLSYAEYEAEIAKLVDTAEAQGANLKRVIPQSPWTFDVNNQIIDTSRIGTQNYYR